MTSAAGANPSEGDTLPAAVILCGGRGAHLVAGSRTLPKPLVEVGGKPILWHVIRIFLAQGVTRLLLLTGAGGDQIEDFVVAESWPAGAELTCLDTGADTPTGGRLVLAADQLPAGRFFVAYADSVADVDLRGLLGFHLGHQGPATMTVARPELPFGVVALDGDGFVRSFEEKPRSDHWINGGFFCFEPAVFDLLHTDSVLEREPLERLADSGRLHAYRHDGFLVLMDTYKETLLLNDLWHDGGAPWKLWS